MTKKILAAVGVLLLILALIPVFLPSHFTLSRSIQIKAPVGVVFSKLTDLNEYVKWNPFPEGDPSNKNKVTGNGLNSFLTWQGDKTGEGKMLISGIEPDSRISVKMDFYKPMAAEAMVYWATKSNQDSTTELTWSYEQDLTYFNRYWGLFMDAMMGQHFEKGLVNFKGMIESIK